METRLPAEYVAALEAEIAALRSLVSWATDAEVVLAAGTKAERNAALRAYGRENAPALTDGEVSE
jgi:hypothetical protein